MAKKEKIFKNVIIRYEFYNRDGVVRLGYKIPVVLRGRDFDIEIECDDPVGYTLLDMIFDDAESCNLRVEPYESRDQNGNVTRTGFYYYAHSVGEDGMVYECRVKPRSTSSRQLLEMVFNPKYVNVSESAEEGEEDAETKVETEETVEE